MLRGAQPWHDGELRQEADQARTNDLVAMGYHVLRVTNEDVLNDVSKVTEQLLQRLRELGQ